MYRSTGTLRYSPKLLGQASEKWWIVVDCDPGLGRLYRHLYHVASSRTLKIQKPAWAEHISVVRNEEPADALKPLWERHAGREVEFAYDPVVGTNGLYFWLPVACPALLDVRRELGLSPEPLYGLHLTIGNALFRTGADRE